MKPADPLLQALREAEVQVTTPPHVERAVLAAWDAEHRFGAQDVAAGRRAGSRPSVPLAWRALSAAAAGVALAIALTMLGGALRSTVQTTPAQAAATLVFVGEPIGRGEPVRVVRMRVPAATLGAIGVRSVAGELADFVDVELIVGEDGVARAIRLGM